MLNNFVLIMLPPYLVKCHMLMRLRILHCVINYAHPWMLLAQHLINGEHCKKGRLCSNGVVPRGK